VAAASGTNSDLSDEVVLGDARTWLARRPRLDRDPD
jgi:hypothetical protein